MNRHYVQPQALPARQRGYTLVEILIALVIALFLVGGLLTMEQTTRQSSANQTGLSQLQDEQRVAMTLLNDVLQTAGYFPDPTTNTASTEFPAIAVAAGGALAQGQAIVGTHTNAATPDTITVQYSTSGTDGIINCTGGTSAVPTTFINSFTVAGGQLLCSPNNGGTTYALVNGVTNMQVWYGVATLNPTTSNAVDTYYTASQMGAANWPNVTSVKVVLTFTNPMAGQAGQPATVTITRVIGLMNRVGVII
jgi:type IV pilus assembly protein PilW